MCVLQQMVNGAFYLTKRKLFVAEGQQHHFSSSYEVAEVICDFSATCMSVVFFLSVRTRDHKS